MKEEKQNEIKIIRNYSFWKHPIKWWKDRKIMKMANFFVNYEWEHRMREEVQKMKMDIFLYGSAVAKNGRRIDSKDVFKDLT